MRHYKGVVLAVLTAMLLMSTSACGRQKDDDRSMAETESVIRETEAVETTEERGPLEEAEDMVSDAVEDGKDIISDVIDGTEMTAVTEETSTTETQRRG